MSFGMIMVKNIYLSRHWRRCWNKVWYLLNKHELDTPFLKGKNAQVIGLMKDELGEKKNDKICWIKRKNLVT